MIEYRLRETASAKHVALPDETHTITLRENGITRQVPCPYRDPLKIAAWLQERRKARSKPTSSLAQRARIAEMRLRLAELEVEKDRLRGLIR